MDQEAYGSYGQFTVINADLTPPRELNKEEVAILQTILKIQVEADPQFNVLNDGQDYEDLIEYAFDMIGDRQSVSHIVEEIQFMEFSCFNEMVAKRFGQCLTKYFQLCERY
jgi:hypothetical protein